MDISEVAKKTGVPASTLRFYEEKGLIRSTGRRGLRRLFDGSVIERLALIAMGRAAGFSLDELAGMFTPAGRPRINRERLSAKAEEIDATVRKLTAMRDGLRHAAACPAKSHMECPKFRRLMRLAAFSAGVERSPRRARSASTTVSDDPIGEAPDRRLAVAQGLLRGRPRFVNGCEAEDRQAPGGMTDVESRPRRVKKRQSV